MARLTLHERAPCVTALAGLAATLLAATNCTDRKVTPAEGGHSAGTVLGQGFTVGVAKSVDLLFVIDDSASMLDKQDVLRQSLLSVLSLRHCQRDDGTQEALSVTGECPEGARPRFPFPTTTRIGVLSSSLDVGGSDACENANRRAHLLPGSDGELFLTVKHSDYENEVARLLDDILSTVGEHGCGYEAPLEVLYRFLVDPQPPLGVELLTRADGEYIGSAQGIDEQVLAERQAFLRPDSFVVAIMLTDEDDCSVSDTGAGWKIAAPDRLTELDADHPNLRCFDQKRRFGESFLFPVERYVRAFGAEEIEDRAGNSVQNPLFAHGRDPSMFRLGALVGVPWQTLATPDSRDAPDRLRYPTGQELEESGAWQGLVGDPTGAADPDDPHLVGSIGPRPELAPPDSAAGTDPIHGHEYDNPAQSDLQYSCTFPLPNPRECSQGDPNCDCALQQVPGTADWAPSSPNRPVCQAPDGSYGTTQYFAKAYPPPRVLQLLSGLSSTAFVGSICPKVLDPRDAASSAYGYNAMLNGLLRDVGANTGIVCLWNDMPLAEDGRIRCRLIEQGPPEMSCDTPGRSAAGAADIRAVEAALDQDFLEGSGFSYCEIDPLAGAPRDPASDAYACANDLDLPTDLAGFCYINPEAGLGNPELVQQCPSDWQRRFRLAPGTRIRGGARVYAACDPKFILD
ncbi:MAG TPA: hypothetical protein VI197_24355 [Polyangiaceae bacterium]